MSREPTVIQGRVPRGERRNLRSFDVNDVLDEVARMVAAAQEQAAEMIASAKREAEQIRATARKEGRAAGHKEGLEAGRKAGHEAAFVEAGKKFQAEQASLIAACRDGLDQWQHDRSNWLASARQDLIELAMAIARRVAHAVGERERAVVLANLEELVSLAGKRSEVTVRVHPSDAETARQFADEMMQQRGTWSHVQVREDAAVAAGGCRVDWGSGGGSAEIDVQLDRIAAELGVVVTSAGMTDQEQASA